MNCLVIDCSTRWIICGIHSRHDGAVIPGAEIRLEAPRESSTRLVAEIGALVKRTGLRPDYILSALGPGSFTGLRIGVTTARDLSQLWNIPAAGIDTLTLYGWAVREHDSIEEPFALLFDGRQKRYYTKKITNDLFTTRDEIIVDLDPLEFESIGLSQVYVDDPSSLSLPERVRIRTIPPEALTARSFFETALKLDAFHPEKSWKDLIPVYIRDNPARPNQPASAGK